MTKIAAKWRPPLWMVVAATLGVVLCLPLIGIVFVRYMWPVMGYREAVWVAGFGTLGATFIVGLVLWRILLRPVQALRERVVRLRAGDDAAAAPLDHYGTADMQALGQSFMDMGRTLLRREAVLRGYADHVTHELKSPLTVVRGASELLASPDLPASDRDRLLEKIGDAADRMTTLLDAQRALARAEEPSMGGEALVSDVVQSVAGGDVKVIQDGVVPLHADALRLVLDHLVGNALAHGATLVSLTVQNGELVVQDDGTGISAGNQSRIFEPFFTTRRAGEGTGMGLPIVRRILDAHGAIIALAPSDTGARFVITF